MQVDADVSGNRDKFRQIVAYAVDTSTTPDTNVPITASITGQGASLLDGTNGINSTTARGDVITLNVEAPSSGTGYSVANVASLKGLTASTTITLNGGIEDTLGNLMANDTTRSDNYITALAATVDAPLTLTTYDLTATTDVTKLNNLFGFSEGVVTGTITDISGTGSQYLLNTGVATLNPGSSDQISVNLGAFTLSNDTGAELNLLTAKAGVINYIGTITLTAARAKTYIIDDSNLTASKNSIDYVLSDAITVANGEDLMAKLSGVGSADYSNGIEDVISAFATTSDLTSDFKVIIGATSNSFADANAPVTISTALSTADHVTALNHITGSSDHTGTVTASITATEAILDDITGTGNILSITATDALSISEYQGIKATTNQSIQFSASGSISDSISTLYDASGTENRHASLHEAISGDKDMNIVVNDISC